MQVASQSFLGYNGSGNATQARGAVLSAHSQLELVPTSWARIRSAPFF